MNIEALHTKRNNTEDWTPSMVRSVVEEKEESAQIFLRKQKRALLRLRQEIDRSIIDVAQNFRMAPSERCLQTHPGDAGSDVADRDFALNMLAHEQVGLYEIEEALRRIELGTYGICEISGKPIPRERLQALPCARFTVEAQRQVERERKARNRGEANRPIRLYENIEPIDKEQAEEDLGSQEKEPAIIRQGFI